MKNTIKVLAAMRSIAIIALLAVIGFSMFSCKEEDSKSTAKVTVVNNYSKSITKVTIYSGAGDLVEDKNGIAAGSTKTFDYSYQVDGDYVDAKVTLFAEGLQDNNTHESGYSETVASLVDGKTTTVKLDSAGYVTAYLE